MSETHLVKAILDALEFEPGVWAARNNTGLLRKGKHRIRYGLGVGGADVIAIVAPVGRLVAIECKLEKGQQSDEQREWQAKVEAVGGTYVVVRSVPEAQQAVRRARAC